MLDARDEFDSHSLTDPRTGSASSLSWEHPSRFSMHQTYSLSAVSSAEGSASSGVYLNTLSYGFTPLMSVFVDVGFHTPIHSSLPGMDDAAGAGSLIIPRMGLEYRPSDRLTFNLELVNGQDAWKAWGGSPSGLSSSRPFPGSRTP